MVTYMICDIPDKEIFDRQCAALNTALPDMTLISELCDVDDSQYKIFDYMGNTIKVSNDYYVGGVFVESEIELTQFFKN